MINPETQIIINDDSKINYAITKKGHNREKPFIQKRPFFFKSYKSEIERIKDHIKNNQYLNGICDSNGDIIFEYKKMKNNTKNKLITNSVRRNRHINLFPDCKSHINSSQFPSNENSINQSQSNRIEVIFNKIFPGKINGVNNLKSLYNSLNEKNSNLGKKNILRKIRTLSEEKKTNFSDSINYKRIINAFEKKLSNEKIKKNKEPKKSFKNESRISNSNNFNNSTHSKLHFKAAEEIAENKYDKRNKSLLLLPNLLKKQKPKLKDEHFVSDTKEEYDKNNEEEEESFFDSFYYKNPYHDLKKRSKYNPNLMKQLSKLAFENDYNLKIYKTDDKIENKINQSFNKKIKRNKSKILKDEDEVEIDGEIFVKTNQFNLITKKILQKCHIYTNKSNKNRNSFKAGNGKNMMTKGLSVNNFMKKYNLRY